jgi:competence ComEA-like helix-hairpin-helix protein
MKNLIFGVGIAAALVVQVTVIASASQASAVAADDEEKFAKAAEALTNKVCSECHDIGMAIDTRRAPKDWNTVVVTMATNGANATDEEFATIKKYLARYYGIVHVNTATAEELSAVLGLSTKDAAAIVDYQKANGNFADAAALAKVPGIDKSKIEAQPEALKFK